MQKRQNTVSVLFMIFSILFCVCLITANILETKQIQVLSVSLTGGLIVFPVSYIINDCVCEVWGYSKARMLIWLGFATVSSIFIAQFFGSGNRKKNEETFRLGFYISIIVGILSTLVICYTLPLRSIAWTLWYKKLSVLEIKAKSKKKKAKTDV